MSETEREREREREREEFKVTDRRGQPKEEDSSPPAPETRKPLEKEKPASGFSGPIDFQTFVLSMSTSAFIHMGLIEDPHTKKAQKNIALARQEIDIIEMLALKTKGNLTKEEDRVLQEVLYELRMRYVQVAK